jgi:6-phosphogluconolactonase (cycloisomerase 2 family)
MKLSRIGRASLAIVVSLAVGLGMTACGGGTIGFMWVLAGKQTSNGSGNSITGFKIDNFTGNLTEMVKSPYTSGGVNPVMAVVRPGGRFVYVVNQGDSTTPGNIAQFTVGGDGVLTFQQSYTTQGDATSHPVWLQMDSSGSFLYVLDTQAPIPAGGGFPAGCTIANCGAITAFSVAGDTGRLTLVTNNTIRVGGTNITYFPTLGPASFTMKAVGGYLLIVNADQPTQTITSYQIGSSTGQLTLTTNSTQTTGATNITSITAGGNYVYLTDFDAATATGTILPYTLNNGVLQTVTGGNVTSFVAGAKPVWTLTDSKGKFVYVLNQTSTSSTTSFSTISAYTVDTSTGKLTKVSDNNNPYPVGAGPVCMVQDPSNQYVYTSNSIDSTVTGFEINQSTGQLNVLRRGSSFPVTGKPTCLVVSGSIN